MNDLLQQHGCSNVFTIPEGLKELMSDISREVLRVQPRSIFDFITNYLSALLITREHGIMAVKILDDLCDCRPSVSEHLLQLGLERAQASTLSEIIKNEIESADPLPGKETVREYQILQKILKKVPLDEEMSAQVCQVVRNAYKDYWYRLDLMKKGMKKQEEEEPWEIAAQHTLELYKRTKPTISELHRATEKIQAAYKGYHVRRHVLLHLAPKKSKKYGRKLELPGPPLDIAASREIDLGPVVNIRQTVQEDNVNQMFEDERREKLGINYDPLKTITHEDTESLDTRKSVEKKSAKLSVPVKFEVPKTKFADETLEVDKEALSADRMSRLPSTRISFSEVPPEVIAPDDGALPEVPEEKDAEATEQAGLTDDDQFLDENYEVAEDLMGEGFDEYTESGAQSGPATADTTIEDITEDGEAGE